MRLLVDANLSHVVAHMLRSAGHDAVHVRDHGLVTASDAEIAEFAVSERRSVISADSDFATNLALSKGTAPSLVLLRSADSLTPTEQAAMLVANLPAVEEALRNGAIASIAYGRVRVRALPLG